MNSVFAWFLGVATGFLSGALGVGGGLVVGPALMLGGHPMRQAFGTVLWVVAPVAFVASVAGLISDGSSVHWLVAACVIAGGQIGAPLGAVILDRLPQAQLRWMFIALLLWVACREMGLMEWTARVDALEGGILIVVCCALGVLAGVTASLFGVGGGVVVVPVLTLMVGGFTFPQAAATSLVAMVPTALRGAWIARAQGRVTEGVLSQIIPGAVLGAVLAVWLRDHVFNPASLEFIFGLFLAFVAVRLATKKTS